MEHRANAVVRVNDLAIALSLSTQRSPSPPVLWPLLLATAVVTFAVARSWLLRSRTVEHLARPLNIDQLVAIMHPEPIQRDYGLPNVETMMKPVIEEPPSKVPHVPAICRECNVMDYLPEDGPRPTRMHWSGLCLKCWAKTPEGQAAAATQAEAAA